MAASINSIGISSSIARNDASKAPQPAAEARRAAQAALTEEVKAQRQEAAAAAEAKAEARPDRQEVSEATQQVAQFFQSVRRELQFREDDVSGRTVISVVDSETGEVIRQIPPEQVVRVAENLGQLKGLLLGERA